MNGIMALFSRMLPQAFIIQQTLQTIQNAWAAADYITAGVSIGGLAKVVIGQPVNR